MATNLVVLMFGAIGTVLLMRSHGMMVAIVSAPFGASFFLLVFVLLKVAFRQRAGLGTMRRRTEPSANRKR